MPITFSGTELIEIAMGIERSGIAFYDVMAASVKDEGARKVFETLAGMERQHLHLFRGMTADVAKLNAPGIFPQADDDYIRALIRNAVFTDEFATGGFTGRAENDRQAIDLGIMAEKDSILFYCQLRDLMPAETKPVVESIMAEERRHLTMLSGVKNLASL
jgi:rubrerythrin